MPSLRFTRVLLIPMALFLCAGCVTTTIDGRPVDEVRPNAIIQGEAKRRLDEMKYMSGRELVDNCIRLAAIGPEIYPLLREYIESENALTRSSVIYTMRLTGDRRNIPYIRERLEDDVEPVRYEAAATLIELGDGSGFPILVRGLSDADIRYRYKCFEALRRVTGHDFGYKHDADLGTRRAAVDRWQDWLVEIRASAK